MTTINTRFEYAWSSVSGAITRPPRPPAATSQEPAKVMAFQPEQQSGPAPHETDFDALLASLEGDPDSAARLANGRQWVSQQFYADSPSLAGLRLAAGLSQRQLADACGMQQPHVSRFESGRHEPGLDMSFRIAAALGVSMELLHAAWANTRQQTAEASHAT